MLFDASANADPLAGLDSRPDNPTCLAGDPPTSTPIFVDVFSQTQPFLPFDMRQSPVDPNRWYFVTRAGKVYTFLAPNGTPHLVLDIGDRIGVLNDSNAYASGGSEQWGLVSLAFHPNFETNGRIFLLYNGRQANETFPTSYVASYVSGGDGTAFDRQTEKLIISQPQPTSLNHHFGHLAFGPDGLLYIGSGDGSSNPAISPAQDCGDLHGKILRINVDTAVPYTVPSGNPFVGQANCRPEVYALGLRNPWRFSFDSATGKLWVGDVGSNLFEEVNIVTNGGNYGYPIVEGTQCRLSTPCDTSGMVEPIYSIPRNSVAIALIGGHVYRGSALHSLVGSYVYSLFSRQQLDSLTRNSTTGTWNNETLLSGIGNFSSHFVDRDGEFYGITGYSSAPVIRKLVQDPSAPTDHGIPSVLSATGCVNPANPRQVVAGAIPYSVNAALWSDGAGKRRWAALPNDGTITIAADGDFQFPVGSVLIKQFSYGGVPHETRLLKRHTNGRWAGYSYAWRDDLSDADLVPTDGITKPITTGVGTVVNWSFPSRSQCLLCHNEAAGFVLGPEVPQLNRIATTPYPQSGRIGNELATWAAIGLFDAPLPAPVAMLPALTELDNPVAANPVKARSYLHANCSGCHRPDGPTRTQLDLRYSTAVSDMHACGVEPAAGDLGIPGAKLLVPQDRRHSLIYYRMQLRQPDLDQMPPLGTTLVDGANSKLISVWINRSDACLDVPDSDGDGVADNSDNCLYVPNPDQADSDNDKYGRRCDGDFNGDGIANATDRTQLANRLGVKFGDTPANGWKWSPRYDINGDGIIDADDLAIFDHELAGRPPGPSAMRP